MTSLAPASRPLVLVDRVFPRSVVTNILLVLAGTGLVALCAQIIIPMVPVPITMQTFAVLFVGTVLGPARGAVALGLYLVLGVAGLPIFAGGDSGNLFAALQRRLHRRLRRGGGGRRMAREPEVGPSRPQDARLVPRPELARHLRLRPAVAVLLAQGYGERLALYGDSSWSRP